MESKESKTWIDDVDDPESRMMFQRTAELCYKCVHLCTPSSFDEWVNTYQKVHRNILYICLSCPYSMELLLIRDQGGCGDMD